MFTSTGLFRNIPCPEGEKCTIIQCIFSHELPQEGTNSDVSLPVSVVEDRVHKKRKLDNAPIQQDSGRTVAPVPASSSLNHGSFKGPSLSKSAGGSSAQVQQRQQAVQPRTLHKTVTPPPLKNGSKPRAASSVVPGPAKPVIKETLNPRRIPHDPAGHGKRTLFLKHIHEELKRLNTSLKNSSHKDKEALTLSEDELIKGALDEEEQIARGNSNVYPNIIKNRIMAYKKMKPDDWVKHVLANFAKAKLPDPIAKKSRALDTGLPLDQEHIFLDSMVSDQTPLVKHGYVPTPPTKEEIAEAEAAVAASLNHEVCDRCKSRFRVFEDRRAEDGALTTNGPCIFHWARPIYPKREKTDAIKGSRDTVYGCCHELLGTKGCTEMETHVFKINDPKRMASVLPFINTPENPSPTRGPNGKMAAAVTFDCEMGYTVKGFELLRLTAVTWPEGDAIIDVLVRPQGAILDLNTRFSGVSAEAFQSATPYSVQKELDALLPPPPPGSEISSAVVSNGAPMPVVDSPADARALLCSYITPSTPLIGHALENDLNIIRLCHPRIIDTVMLFPHPRGLPIRFSLKILMKQRLDRDIQMESVNGHDSLEDARATGELVRYAVKKRWGEMKLEGWQIKDGALMPPLPKDSLPLSGGEELRVLGGGTGVKRQRI